MSEAVYTGVARALQEWTPPAMVAREVVREVRVEPSFREDPPLSQLSQDLGHVGHHSPRPKTAADKVREYLDQHDVQGLTVRELEAIIGVGKSTVSRVLNERMGKDGGSV